MAGVSIGRVPFGAWSGGVVAGVLAGLGAGALWGMTFVAPLVAPGFGSVDFTIGRYLACGLLSVVLVAWQASRGTAPRPTWRQAGAALGLSVLGYTGYYLLLVLAIQDAGAALPVLVIGTIPLAIMLLGKPGHLRWRTLAPGLLLTAGGLVFMMVDTLAAHDSDGGGRVWRGLLFAALAMASWTAFGLWNARWLRRHPEVPSTVWANWLGVAAGVGALGLAAAAGEPWGTLSDRPGFGLFVLVCAITGVGSAWVAAVLWNMASRRLSASLAGQLIVSETVFGLIYSFAWNGQWPGVVQWLACALFVLGILASIKAHR